MCSSHRLESLPLLIPWPGLTFISNDRVQLDFDRVLRIVPTVPLAPIVADGVGKDVAGATKAGGGDAAADFRVAFETVLGVLVPEVECAVTTGGAEGAVDGVEGDCIYRVDFCDVTLSGVGLAVAFEREVEAVGMCQHC